MRKKLKACANKHLVRLALRSSFGIRASSVSMLGQFIGQRASLSYSALHLVLTQFCPGPHWAERVCFLWLAAAYRYSFRADRRARAIYDPSSAPALARDQEILQPPVVAHLTHSSGGRPERPGTSYLTAGATTAASMRSLMSAVIQRLRPGFS